MAAAARPPLQILNFEGHDVPSCDLSFTSIGLSQIGNSFPSTFDFRGITSSFLSVPGLQLSFRKFLESGICLGISYSAPCSVFYAVPCISEA